MTTSGMLLWNGTMNITGTDSGTGAAATVNAGTLNVSSLAGDHRLPVPIVSVSNGGI